MKNKKILIIIILLLVLGVFAWQHLQKSNYTTESMGQKIADKAMEAISYKCEIKNENSGTSTVYVKNKMIRTQNDFQNTKSNLIIKNNQFWVWENSKTEGMTWVLPTGTESEGKMPSLGGIASIGFNYQALLSGSKDMLNNCSPTSIDDKLFDVPSNVTFQDMSQLGDSVQKMLQKSTQSNTGDKVPSDEEIQNMIQKQMQ